MDIRIHNTNTGCVLTSTIEVDDEGKFREYGDHRISGYSGTGSRIKIRFDKPVGSMTGKLFPSGTRQNTITVSSPGLDKEVSVRATLIDAANPFIFVDSSTLPPAYHQLGPDSPCSLHLIESIRRKGAVLFGLASDVEQAARTRATPKIAVLSPPRVSAPHERQPDIDVTAFSMGKLHPSLQLTGAVSLGAATGISSTVASDLARDGRPPKVQMPHPWIDVESPHVGEEEPNASGTEVCIGQRGGRMLADVKVGYFGRHIETVTVDRTAQRLFSGKVMLRL